MVIHADYAITRSELYATKEEAKQRAEDLKSDLMEDEVVKVYLHPPTTETLYKDSK